jgi:ketosteroid isomerase-like protein
VQDNVRRTQEAYAAFGQGDIPTVLENMTDDIEWVIPGPAELPPSGTQHGKQELGAWFGKLNEALEFQRFEPYKFLGEGDTVVALLHVAARWRHNGAPTEADEVHVFTYRDGKVARFEAFQDTAKFLAAYRLP